MAASRTRDWEFDPGIEAIVAPYTMAAHAYMSETLGVESTARYEVLSMEAHKQWNWNRGEEKGNSFAMHEPGSFARAAAKSAPAGAGGERPLRPRHARTAPPTGRSRSSTAPPEVLARVEHHYFDAGHMMYTREADMKKLKKDLAAWLRS